MNEGKKKKREAAEERGFSLRVQRTTLELENE